MNFLKTTVNSSPFVGIFARASEDFALVPLSLSEKKLGALCTLFENKIAVPEIAEETEKKNLKENGLEIKEVRGYSALGNLVSINKNGGIASTLLTKKEVAELEEFFGVKMVRKNVANTVLVGSAIHATDRGFIVHPNVKEQEFLELKKIFGVNGQPTTANYGDRLVGNDVVANSKGALIGEITTPFEMIRIDEALRGE
ncbi:MAG: translation initiation factor IF-6 [Candidatus Diapherotrites archaeon]|nr:translation initiation factor IF-6 [Candidatus Diapherotrites archaeon]